MELKPGGANQPQEFDPKNGQYVDEGKGTAEQDFYLIKFRGVEPKVFDEQFVQPILFQGNVFPFLQKHPESFLKKGYKLVEVKQKVVETKEMEYIKVSIKLEFVSEKLYKKGQLV